MPKEAFCCFLRGQLGVRALSLLWWLLLSYFSRINAPFSGLAKENFFKKCPKCSGKKCANIVRKCICQDYGLGGECVYFLYFSRFWQWACTFLKLFLLTARTTSTSVILDLGPGTYLTAPTQEWHQIDTVPEYLFFTGGKTLMVEVQTSEDLWGDFFFFWQRQLNCCWNHPTCVLLPQRYKGKALASFNDHESWLEIKLKVWSLL